MTRVAAVDCGTNSIRLLVTDLGTGREVVRRMQIVRLGEGVDRTGELAPAAIERTRVALAGFAEEISRQGVARVRFVATSATRDARGRADFVAMVRATLGVEPEVISGADEAALSFRGAMDVADGLPEPVLVVDIGGGSTEFVLGDAAGPRAARSVDIGCVRMTERHLHSDPPTPAEIAAATGDVRAAIGAAALDVPITDAATLIGLAGSVTTVAAMALGLGRYDAARIHGAWIPAADLRSVCRKLLEMPRSARAQLPFMHPGRVDVIGAGALVVREVVEAAGVNGLVASEHDILDGIAASLA